MAHHLVTDLDVRGKRVFCRVDFNVPLAGGAITDDRRIREALPTIRQLAAAGARVICASHLGRPKGGPSAELSLAPIAVRLSQLLGQPVTFVGDCVGDEVTRVAQRMADGDVALLENLRFHPGEEKGDPEFAQKLAANMQVYVNDAFGAAHRAHASITGLPMLLGGGAVGFLMERELGALSRLLHAPERPYVAILGGAKVSDKIELIEKLLPRIDALLVGGAMAYTFLRAQGHSVGASLVEADKLELAREIESRCQAAGVTLELPRDHVTATQLEKKRATGLADCASIDIPDGQIGVDIGPATRRSFIQRLAPLVRTVLWNGPLGLFEAAGCEAGTRVIAEHLAGLGAFRVLGGGDTAAAAAVFGLESRYDHVSTGGGAALEYLSGVTLPGVAALES